MSRIQDLLIPTEPEPTIKVEPRDSTPDGPSHGGSIHFSVEFVLDTICVYCFIGLKNLSAAMDMYRAQHPGATFEIVCSPFMLNPEASSSGKVSWGAEFYNQQLTR
jgi:hypothetical protein